MSSERPSARDRLREKIDRHRERVERIRARHELRRGGGLSTEQIAAAAVAIADAQGLDELSMRKIAAVLGAGTMSLYHHVRTKDDLLAIMDDLIMGEILVPQHDLDAGWRKAMEAIARQTQRAFRKHPWALTAKRSSRRGTNSLRHVDQSLAALSDTGANRQDKMAILTIVDDYVFGHAFRAASLPRFEGREAEAAMTEAATRLGEQMATGEFHNLRELIGDESMIDVARRIVGDFDPDAWFERGLEALLDGLAIRFALPAAPSP